MSEVYKAIAAVMADMAVGIAKSRTATAGRSTYAYRGIEDVLKVLNSSLTKHGLVIIPEVLERITDKELSSQGNTLFYTRIKMAFNLVSTSDGSKHTAITYGEAMDSGDKGHNKAMSVAYKYMAFQTFCIPTEGLQNDTEEEHHEIVAPPAQPKPVAVTPPPPKKVLDDPIADEIAILVQGLAKQSQALNISNVVAKNLYFKKTGLQSPNDKGALLRDYYAGMLAYITDLAQRFNGVGGTLDATERELLGLPVST